MAEVPAGTSPLLGLSEIYVPDRTFDIDAPGPIQFKDIPSASLGGAFVQEGESFEPSVCYAAEDDFDSMGDTWFEIIHVFPYRFDFGNILTTVTDEIQIYNADRFSSHTLEDFINNAGDGVSITDLPTLPYVIDSQTGLTLTLEVTTDGPPDINDTLDFDFDLYTTMIPITGSRIVMFPFRPESPIREQLEWSTDILTKKKGAEQRISVREYPRQFFNLSFVRSEGEELSRLDFMVYDWQARIFGIPLWHEAILLTADATGGDTTITVGNTSTADFRVGGIAIVIVDETTFDALEIESVSTNSITFASPLANSYSAGAEVIPIRTAYGSPTMIGRRYPVNLAEREFTFQVEDNNVGSSFADATPYFASGTGLIDGEVLLDDPNWIATGRTMNESMDREFIDVDGGTGKLFRDSAWETGKRIHSKGFVTSTRSGLWAIRRLLHYLRGQQVAFWLPSFFKDLTPVATLTIGSTSLTITNVGYARFVRQRANRDLIRITATDGTVIWRRITASAELSATQEQLTVSSGWDATRTIDQIQRIDIVSNVRIDSDRVELLHFDSAGESRITFPVREVFDE